LISGGQKRPQPIQPRTEAFSRASVGMAYCCSEARYDEAIRHPEACIEVGFPIADVKMKEAAN
jgi:hypothetical protein